MSDGIGLVEVLLGLDGFRVLAVNESVAEVVITIETDADLVGCARCGVRAEAQDRMPIAIRDLACFWAAGTPGVEQAAVALRRGSLRREDVDGTLGACRRAGGDHTSGGDGGVSSGR